MKEQLITFQYDWDRERMCAVDYYLDSTTLEAMQEITADTLYQHLRKAIGKVTPRGETKLLPYLKVGELTLSLQLNYQLWYLRQEKSQYEDVDYSPMTKAEFNTIIKGYEDPLSLFDFAVWDTRTDLVTPGETTISRLLEWLREIYQDGIINNHA